MGGKRPTDFLLAGGALLFGLIVYRWTLSTSLEAGPVPANGTSPYGPEVAAGPEPDRDSLRTAREKAGAGEILGGPMFQPYRGDGRLNPYLLELAGIPASRLEEMEALLDGIREHLSAELDARRKLLPQEPGQEGVVAFTVPADPEAARTIREDFEAQVRSKFGKAAARIYVPQVADREDFAGWGKFDLEIRFYMQEGYGGMSRVAEYKATDPATGKRMLQGGTSEDDSFRVMFGSAFSDVKPGEP